MKSLYLILVLAFAPLSLAAKVEFVGVFYLGNQGSFSLEDSTTGKKSGWISVGQSFQGYRIEFYNRDSRLLRLASGDTRIQLSLRASSGPAEEITISGKMELKLGSGEKIEVEDAIIVLGEKGEARFPVTENTWLRLTVEQTDDGRLVYAPIFEELDSVGNTALTPLIKVTALPKHRFATMMNGYEFSYDPEK